MRYLARALLPVLVLLAACVCLNPLISMGGSGSAGPPTRAVGEDLRIELDVHFLTPTHYTVDVEVNVHKIILESDLYNKTEIREMYSISPNETSEALSSEIMGRALDTISVSMGDDNLTVVSGELDLTTMDNESTMSGAPIVYRMEVDGVVDILRFLTEDQMDDIDEDRYDHVISALFLSGFTYSRTIDLVAEPGETVTYMFPRNFDPFGDGEISITINTQDADIEGDKYTVTVQGGVVGGPDHLTFTLGTDGGSTSSSEEISGYMIIDWYELDLVDCSGTVTISSLDSNREGMMNELPPSISRPDTIIPGLVRYAFMEGLLDAEDRTSIEEQVSDEVGSSIEEALEVNDSGIVSVLDLGIGEMQLPDTGAQLKAIVLSDEHIDVDTNTERSISLDVLEGYDRDDVKGLLNGGMSISREFEQITDERFDITLKLPDHLYFKAEEPSSTDEGGRNSYTYSPGIKELSSERAPTVTGEEIELMGDIDLTNVESTYGADAEIEMECSASIDVSYVEYDEEDFDVNTTLDYSIEYLSSDVIRLLIDMGIIERDDVEDRITEEITDMMDSLIPRDNQELDVNIDQQSYVFDEDMMNMTGENPISISIELAGVFSPLEKNRDSGEDNQNGFLPYHMDPVLPVRAISRSISLEGMETWSLDLDISFPSGVGIKGWIGNGSNDKVVSLEVSNEDGHPTLHVTRKGGQGDHIFIEMEFGPYFALNNVTLCFASTICSLVMFLLIILLVILRIVAKKKKGKKDDENVNEEENGADTEETDTAGSDNEEEEMKW